MVDYHSPQGKRNRVILAVVGTLIALIWINVPLIMLTIDAPDFLPFAIAFDLFIIIILSNIVLKELKGIELLEKFTHKTNELELMIIFLLIILSCITYPSEMSLLITESSAKSSFIIPIIGIAAIFATLKTIFSNKPSSAIEKEVMVLFSTIFFFVLGASLATNKLVPENITFHSQILIIITGTYLLLKFYQLLEYTMLISRKKNFADTNFSKKVLLVAAIITTILFFLQTAYGIDWATTIIQTLIPITILSEFFRLKN